MTKPRGQKNPHPVLTRGPELVSTGAFCAKLESALYYFNSWHSIYHYLIFIYPFTPSFIHFFIVIACFSPLKCKLHKSRDFSVSFPIACPENNPGRTWHMFDNYYCMDKDFYLRKCPPAAVWMMDCSLGIEGEGKLCAKAISRKCAVRYPSHFHFQPGCDISAGDRRTKA